MFCIALRSIFEVFSCQKNQCFSSQGASQSKRRIGRRSDSSRGIARQKISKSRSTKVLSIELGKHTHDWLAGGTCQDEKGKKKGGKKDQLKKKFENQPNTENFPSIQTKLN